MADNRLLDAAAASLEGIVETALALSTALWKCHNDPACHRPAQWPPPNLSFLNRDHVARAFRKEIFDSALGRTPGVDPDGLVSSAMDMVYGPQTGGINQNYFSALYILNQVRPALWETAELQYALMRRIRQKSEVILSAGAARAAYKLADNAQRIAAGADPVGLSYKILRPCLSSAVSIDAELRSAGYVQLAMDIWSALGAIRPNVSRPGNIDFQPDSLDGGLLLAAAFGVPTSIPGFDDLFNGGLILPDVIETELDSTSVGNRRVGARTVVITAPFGSGKSLLSLQLAVEVARKGGVAWILELEQSAQECLYALESIATGVETDAFTVVTGYSEAFPVLSRPTPGRGALVFLPVGERGSTTFAELVQKLPDQLHWLNNYPLRLLIIDPLSAVYPAGTVEDRKSAVELLRKAKAASVNICITSERKSGDDAETQFEENIADTVIRLGVNRETSERYVEVTKSRLQRERAGRHVFRITNEGLRIHPTPAGYLRQQTGSIAGPLKSTKPVKDPKPLLALGVRGLNDILGRDAIYEGDILALHGATGTSKTILGLQFLRAIERPPASAFHSLFIADISEARMRHLIQQSYRQESTDEQRSENKVLILPIAPGLADPGELLSTIQQKFESEEARERRIDRVLITNLSRWQLDMPRVGEDESFPLALLALVRRYRATTILVCGHSAEQPGSRLENLLLEMSDCSLELKRVEFRGQDRYYLQVLKSHQMTHRRGRFEVTIKDSLVSVSPKESLIRLDGSGKAQPVNVVLFLHSETQKHHLYNKRLVGALTATLSPRTSLAPQTRSYDPQVRALSSASGLDEMQILQLDEFQLPRGPKGIVANSGLHMFPHSLAGPLLDGRLHREGCMLHLHGEVYIFAIPFYSNISLLACQKQITGPLPADWSDIADKAASHTGLYFACHADPTNNFESYNCFFLEIFYSKQKPPASSSTCSLENWFRKDRKKTEEALRCFYLLLSPFHKRISEALTSTRTDEEWQALQNRLTGEALISRHWYNTLNQMMAGIPPTDRSKYAVEWLPNERPEERFVTTAGEWYLAVPQYSAAPEVALDVIAFLTNPDKEMQRIHIGVGLPTRSDYYRSKGPDVPSDVSPYFSLDMNTLEELIRKAFRRSQFSCYQAFAETMSSHLQRLLETESPNFSRTLDGLLASLEFFQSREMCETCNRGKSAV